LSDSINHVLKVKKNVIKLLGKLKLYNALLKLVVGLYPNNRERINSLYEKLLVGLEGTSPNSITNNNESQLLVDIILRPILQGNATQVKLVAKADSTTDGSSSSSELEYFASRDFLLLRNVSGLLTLLAPAPRKEAAVGIMFHLIFFSNFFFYFIEQQ
jgi:hypothetical protein